MINVLELKPGARLRLRGGLVAEVTENMEDGMWLQVRYVAAPEQPELVGETELCHAQDVLGVMEEE